MKKLFLTNLIYGLLTIYSFGQNESIESKLMDCVYENRPGFKEFINNYEQLLISENILTDKNGMSYKILLERIRFDKQFDYCASKSYMDENLKLVESNGDLIRTCQSQLLNESKEQNLKINEMRNALNNLVISGNLNPSNIANEILSVLSEKEFEHYYYRDKLLFLLSIICKSKK
jgi:hypothetical protein